MGKTRWYIGGATKSLIVVSVYVVGISPFNYWKDWTGRINHGARRIMAHASGESRIGHAFLSKILFVVEQDVFKSHLGLSRDSQCRVIQS